MPFIPLDDWIATLMQQDENPERKQALLEAQILARNAVDKLESLGFQGISPMIDVKNTMGVGLEEAAIFYQSLSSTEAIRLLMIADYMDLNKKAPSLFDLANYKSDQPTRDDASNEGRVVNQLEERKYVKIDRSGGDLLSDDRIGLTKEGIEVVKSYMNDSQFLTKIYKRSRSQKIREFILKYIENEQKTNL